MEVYLDNAATTRTNEQVVSYMEQVFQVNYGNPSSKHRKGVTAEGYIREAKEIFASLLKVQEKEIYFTSGGTESNNMAVLGAALANKRKGKHIITSAVEHASIISPMTYLEELGFQVTYLPVDENGIIKVDALKEALDSETILVSIMGVNNEVGAVEPIEEIGRCIKESGYDIIYHVDAIQMFGKFRIYPKRLGIDLLSISGHKIYGPKGSGVLFVKDKTKIKPIIYGGHQQNGLRSGTENVPAIAGMGLAAKIMYEDFDDKLLAMNRIKDRFVEEISKVSDCVVQKGGAPHIVSVTFKGVRSEVLLHALEEEGVYVSSGSACSSNRPELSGTLLSMGLSKEDAESTLRFSFSVDTSAEEIDYAIERVNKLLPILRKFKRR